MSKPAISQTNEIRSIAIWCPKKIAEDKIEITAHFNLWKLKENNNCLDIGLKIPEINKIASIKIFFPFKVNDEDMEDLCSLFEKLPKLISAVFNEPYKANLPSNGKPFKVTHEDDPADTFSMCQTAFSIPKVDPTFGGSIVIIDIPQGINGNAYFRLRCKSKYLKDLTHLYSPPNSILLSAFFNTEIIDFRINEERTLSQPVSDLMHQEGEITFKQINCFVMHEANYDFIFANTEIHGSRELENDIWGQYIGRQFSSERIVAYHWKRKNNDKEILKDFNVFAKFKYEKSNFLTISIFVFGLIIIGFLGSLLANLMYNKKYDQLGFWILGILVVTIVIIAAITMGKSFIKLFHKSWRKK